MSISPEVLPGIVVLGGIVLAIFVDKYLNERGDDHGKS